MLSNRPGAYSISLFLLAPTRVEIGHLMLTVIWSLDVEFHTVTLLLVERGRDTAGVLRDSPRATTRAAVTTP